MAGYETMPDSKLNSDVDIYQDDIDMYLDQYCQEHNIDNVYDIRPQQWTAGLMYINRHTFRLDNSALRPRGVESYGYDLQAVDTLVDRYIYLCMSHNQRVSVLGFSILSGISVSTLQDWSTGKDRAYEYYSIKTGDRLSSNQVRYMEPGTYGKRPTFTAKELYQKLLRSEGQSLEDSLTDRKKNPMHTLPLFNAFQARHATKQERPQLDTGSIAESLGITAELQGIPDKKSHSNG